MSAVRPSGSFLLWVRVCSVCLISSEDKLPSVRKLHSAMTERTEIIFQGGREK